MEKYTLPLVLTLALLTLPIVWFITDPRTPEERFKSYLRPKSLFLSLAEVLIVVLTLISVLYFPWPKMPLDNLVIIFGVLLFFSGMFLAVWAKLVMKSSWGLPGELDAKRQNKIVRKGPFSFSRNPIYLGLILVILGYTLALRSYSILLVFFVILYFYQAILKEEKILTKHFGKDYLEYKSKVRRFF